MGGGGGRSDDITDALAAAVGSRDGRRPVCQP
jgi:hypothetical protein